VFVAFASIAPFFVSVWVGVLGDLMLWSLFGFQALADVERVEFDRGSRTMRQRSTLGLKWTDRLDRFAGVRVIRATSGRGHLQIRVTLKRAGVVRFSESPEYLVAVYGFPGEGDEKEAREWGDRLAQFLHLPLEVEL
jgi:hypothetical protein